MKKDYNAPSIRSVKINEPLAYACTITNLSQCCGGTWSGCDLPDNPQIICN